MVELETIKMQGTCRDIYKKLILRNLIYSVIKKTRNFEVGVARSARYFGVETTHGNTSVSFAVSANKAAVNAMRAGCRLVMAQSWRWWGKDKRSKRLFVKMCTAFR